jgi:heme-degrading monooxygenase HmoA
MFCLASRYQTSPQSLDQVARIFQEQAIPLVSRQPGFKGVYLMAKPTGEFTILNIWDTEQQANAWPQNPEHQKVVAQLRPLLSGAPVRDGYVVRAHAVG